VPFRIREGLFRSFAPSVFFFRGRKIPLLHSFPDTESLWSSTRGSSFPFLRLFWASAFSFFFFLGQKRLYPPLNTRFFRPFTADVSRFGRFDALGSLGIWLFLFGVFLNLCAPPFGLDLRRDVVSSWWCFPSVGLSFKASSRYSPAYPSLLLL